MIVEFIIIFFVDELENGEPNNLEFCRIIFSDENCVQLVGRLSIIQ